MSIEATRWVWEQAPPLPSHLMVTLLFYAHRADKYGRGAFPSMDSVAKAIRKDKSNAKRAVAALIKEELLILGDQSLVAHISPDRRPVVYDLPGAVAFAGDVTTNERGGAHAPSRERADAPSRRRAHAPSSTDSPVNGSAPAHPRGGAPAHERGRAGAQAGVRPRTPKGFESPLKENPPTRASSTASAPDVVLRAVADATEIEDEVLLKKIRDALFAGQAIRHPLGFIKTARENGTLAEVAAGVKAMHDRNEAALAKTIARFGGLHPLDAATNHDEGYHPGAECRRCPFTERHGIHRRHLAVVAQPA